MGGIQVNFWHLDAVMDNTDGIYMYRSSLQSPKYISQE